MRWLRKWLDLSLRAKCLLLISFPAAATVAMAGASYMVGTRTAAANQQLNTSLRIGSEIERLRTCEIEASAHVRAYLITADEPFADKAREALADFDSTWQKLSYLTADQPAQKQRLGQVAALERLRIERIFGNTARFRSRDLPWGQLRVALNAAEAERLELERILNTMEETNTGAITAYLGRVNALRGRQNGIMTICVFFGIAGGLAMTLLFAHGITGRIGKLHKNIAELSRGGVNIAPLHGWDEIGVLNDGLLQIERLLQHRRTALESALHGIAEVDSLGRYVWFNKAYGEIAGVSEVYRPPSLEATLPIENRPRIEKAVRIMNLAGRAEITVRLEPPRSPATDVEMTFLCPPGMPDARLLRIPAGDRVRPARPTPR